MYENPKLAISNLFKINSSKLKKLKTVGMEHDYIYSLHDKVYKITSSKTEFLASKRIIGNKFNNVVNIFDSYECDILSPNKDSIWKSYIIEEEKLFRDKSLLYKNIDLKSLSFDLEKRLPLFVSIINGLIELSSVGIIYDDFHTMNVMRDKNNNIKIIDFGLVILKKDVKNIKNRLFLK
jgi:serine/threonine protein kinase